MLIYLLRLREMMNQVSKFVLVHLFKNNYSNYAHNNISFSRMNERGLE